MIRRGLSVFCLLVALGSAGQQRMTACTRWSDSATGLVFPSQIGGLVLSSRTDYGERDFSLRYHSDDSRAVRVGGTHLDIYVFQRAGDMVSPSGVRRELATAVEQVVRLGENGKTGSAESAYYDVRLTDGGPSRGTLKKSGLEYLWKGFSFRARKDGEKNLSCALVTSYRGWYVKLRYSAVCPESLSLGKDEFPPQFIVVLSELDALVKRAQEAQSVDVYAIKDPRAAYAALCAKHAGVEMRVGPWELPDFGEMCDELGDVLKWCAEDVKDRCQIFERVARMGIAKRVDPAFWYYNLACALALQDNRKEEAVTALEQAVAAGCFDVEHLRKDEDLVSLRKDIRFEKLAVMMQSADDAEGSAVCARQTGRTIELTEENVEYDLSRHVYLTMVSRLTSPAKGVYPVLFLDQGGTDSKRILEENPGFVELRFPQKAQELERGRFPGNIMVRDREAEVDQPVFVVCGLSASLSPSNSVTGFGALLSRAVRRMIVPAQESLLTWNVLAFYAADADYGQDGIDRHLGVFPGCLEYVGSDAAPFVRAANVALQALPEKVRAKAVKEGVVVPILLSLVRGDVMRPALTVQDLDLTAIAARARALKEVPPLPPCLLKAEFDPCRFVMTDLWDAPYDRPHLADSVTTHTFVHTYADWTGRYSVSARCVDKDVTVDWRLLQGDPAKVRIVPDASDATRAWIEVDYHKVFEVPLPNGKVLKSSRVDIGCFAVRKGARSLPTVVSVYFSPNETRTCDASRRLVEIDYTRPQLPAYQPSVCARGDWRDVFEWTEDGKLLGWTRIRKTKDGETRTPFTREGLVVMTRDEEGRPQSVRRDLYAKFFQTVPPWRSEKERNGSISWCRNRYDEENRPGPHMTLAWHYTYTNKTDRFGRPAPVMPVPWKDGREQCRRAAFTTTSGFHFPLVRQMQLGYYRYVGYKCGRLDADVEDLQREDGAASLSAKGLKQPETLERMAFCPWKPASSDVWKVDLTKAETGLVKNLRQLGDGVVRLWYPETDESDEEWLSVVDTREAVNGYLEQRAYVELDKAYPRCSEEVATTVFHSALGTEVWEGCKVSVKGRFGTQPDGCSRTFAAWRIAERVYFGIYCDWMSEGSQRAYLFAKVPTAEPSAAVGYEPLNAPPSPAVGNTIVASFTGQAEALNNLAVLKYAGVVNSDAYEERVAVNLLMSSARKGNVTAMRNLAVLYTNCGEPARARQFLEAARLKEEADRDSGCQN